LVGKLVVLARTAQKSLVSGEHDPLISHYSKQHLWQLLRISWLAPDIIAAIVGGTQPATFTGRCLLPRHGYPARLESTARSLPVRLEQSFNP
jgi:site-specific DNA recombinase